MLRRTLQEGARRIPADQVGGDPLLAESSDDLRDFQHRLLIGSRGARTDWVSRYLLPKIEEFATEHLMQQSVPPLWLIWGAVGLTLVAAFCFSRGWLGAGLVLMILGLPLDLIASRLAALRLRPLPVRLVSRQALWPAAGLALFAIGWWEMRHGSGWGALVTALSAAGFAEAARTERAGIADAELWLISRRSAVIAAIPFAIAGEWTSYLVGLLAYAALSFFIVQHVRHNEAD